MNCWPKSNGPADLSRIAPAPENFRYRSDSSPEGSLRFFRYWNLQNPHNGSFEMNSRQNEEGRPSPRPSLYNQLSFQWEDPLH